MPRTIIEVSVDTKGAEPALKRRVSLVEKLNATLRAQGDYKSRGLGT